MRGPQNAKKDKAVTSRTSGRTLTFTEGDKYNILQCVRDGMNAKDIAKKYELDYSSLLRWRHEEFPIEWEQANMQYQLSQAEEFTDRLMKLESGKKDSSLLAIQQKESEFRRKYLLNAKSKYNDAPQIAIQVNLPQPIIDLGKLDSEKAL